MELFDRQILTKAAAAEKLNLSVRQIDRLVKSGQLTKVLTGANRSGITRDSIEAHLTKLNGADDEFDETLKGTRATLLRVELPEPSPHAAYAIDRYLARRFPGCFVSVDTDRRFINVYWAWSLPYESSQIRGELKKLEALTVTITV